MYEKRLREVVVIEHTPGDVSDGCSSYFHMERDMFLRVDEVDYDITVTIVDRESAIRDIAALYEDEWIVMGIYGIGAELVPAKALEEYQRDYGQIPPKEE